MTTLTVNESATLLNQLEIILKGYGLSEQKSLGEMSEMAYSRNARNIKISYDVDLNDVFDGISKIDGMIVRNESNSREFGSTVFPYTVITF
jgi:myo-inositol-hexaphosphate 3-phosphohydrolase